MTCDREWPWRRTPRLAGPPAVLAQIIRRAALRPQPRPGRRLPCRCAPGKASWAPGSPPVLSPLHTVQEGRDSHSENQPVGSVPHDQMPFGTWPAQGVQSPLG